MFEGQYLICYIVALYNKPVVTFTLCVESHFIELIYIDYIPPGKNQ